MHGLPLTEEDKKIAETLSKIKNKIAILSGKGGTGKTTVTVNIAQTLSNMGFKVGVLDADITGPNVPLMFGVEDDQMTSTNDKIQPVEAEKIKIVSMEFLLQDKTNAIIWRGPMKIKALKQLLADVNWGELDFLIVDLPPGSSDEPLSIVQTFQHREPDFCDNCGENLEGGEKRTDGELLAITCPHCNAENIVSREKKIIKDLDGMVVVTTPQNVSLLDVTKSINFAQVTDTPIIGIIENMSGFMCPHCNETTYIFKKDGGKKMAEELSLDFLGAIPLYSQICEAGDRGRPAVQQNENIAEIFKSIVEKLLEKLKEK